MIRALLIEDDFDLANTVVDFLSIENIECDHASNGISGLNFIEENHYDIVLLDLNLPRLDGISVCQSVRKKGFDIPILMLTARDQLKDKVAGFDAGTDDYLIKPFELEELVVRVKALSRRRSGQAQILKCGDLEMNLAEKSVTRNKLAIKLSPTGWQLLETLLRASPNPVPRTELEHSIWGDDIPDSNSLKVHIFHLRKNIDTPFDKALIHTIAGHGFALKDNA
jgi:DNA-binding response OmpR family regulator